MHIFSHQIRPLRLMVLTAMFGFMTYEHWPKPPAPALPPHVMTQAERAQMEALVAPSMGAVLAGEEFEARKRAEARKYGGTSLTPEARRAWQQEFADPLHHVPRTPGTGITLPTPELALNHGAVPAK